LALRRLNETLEREIQRIAQAVHDEAGQLLVAAHLAVAEIERDPSSAVRKRLRGVRTILGQTEKELRRISHELRPTVLDDLGLVPALRLLAGNASRGGRLSVRVESALKGRPAPRIEVAVYRVVQEALANVARHARARNVSVRISADASKALRCRVKDDGKGFDAASVLGRGEPRGLGLIAMRERLHAVGGGLQIRSEPGRGTEILLSVPMEA
jgi:signal transduction histidine kinase